MKESVMESKGEVDYTHEKPVNTPDTGPLGFGLLPAMKKFIGGKLLKSFLDKQFKDQISTYGDTANTMVAHASKDPPMSSLNVAMPDLSAEYWATYIPADKFPVYHIKFPEWAIYSALTAYDSTGLPVASINSLEALSGKDDRVSKEEAKDSLTNPSDQRMVINVMKGVKWSGPLCVLLRVYRPREVVITPPEQLPLVRFLPKEQMGAPPAGTDFLPNATQAAAIANGKLQAEEFTKMIGAKLPALKPKQKGSQFFMPKNLGGLFPNANATYVVVFPPAGKSGLRIKNTVIL